jgi:Bacterial protein of unknown function (DUF899)
MIDDHPVVSHDTWVEARRQFLAKEKEFNRLRDELSAQRRALPWERVEKPYVFDGPNGRESLADLSTTSCLAPTGPRVAKAAPPGQTTSTASTSTWRIAT